MNYDATGEIYSCPVRREVVINVRKRLPFYLLGVMELVNVLPMMCGRVFTSHCSICVFLLLWFSLSYHLFLLISCFEWTLTLVLKSILFVYYLIFHCIGCIQFLIK